MAFIHFAVPEGSSGWSCEIDRRTWINFKGGDYEEIPNGYHVISFETGIQRWNIQETLEEDDCIEVLMVINFDGIVGEPTYSIEKISERKIEWIRGQLAEKEVKAEKKQEIRKHIRHLIILGYITITSLALSVAGLTAEGMQIIAVPCIAIAALFGILFVRKLKKFRKFMAKKS